MNCSCQAVMHLKIYNDRKQTASIWLFRPIISVLLLQAEFLYYKVFISCSTRRKSCKILHLVSLILTFAYILFSLELGQRGHQSRFKLPGIQLNGMAIDKSPVKDRALGWSLLQAHLKSSLLIPSKDQLQKAITWSALLSKPEKSRPFRKTSAFHIHF